MTNLVSSESQVHRPRLLERMFRLTPLPAAAYEDTAGMVPAAICIDVEISVGWIDRLKLFVTGKALLRARVKTSVHVDRAVTFSSFSVVHRHRVMDSERVSKEQPK